MRGLGGFNSGTAQIPSSDGSCVNRHFELLHQAEIVSMVPNFNDLAVCDAEYVHRRKLADLPVGGMVPH
jgi:hypothetical protein